MRQLESKLAVALLFAAQLGCDSEDPPSPCDDESFNYNVVVERVASSTECLPRAITVDNAGTPDDPSDPVEKNACLTDPNFVPAAGWCYVDPLPPPSGQGIGDEAVVADCPDTEKRSLRFQPASGTLAYVSCVGS